MNKTVVIGIVFVVAVLGFLVYSSMNIAHYRVEVCVARACHAQRSIQRLRLACFRSHRHHAVRASRTHQHKVARQEVNCLGTGLEIEFRQFRFSFERSLPALFCFLLLPQRLQRMAKI
jgi:hypothetical protein